jgi:aldehyde dehydrogenase (NAD+)
MAQAKKAVSKNRNKQGPRPAPRAAVKTYHNYINGEWVGSESGEMFENINPANSRDIIGRFPLSTSEDINAAVNAAHGAFDRWRNTPAPKRAELLFRLGEILMRNKERYTADMTREMGKVLKEAGGDVQEAIDLHLLHCGGRSSSSRLSLHRRKCATSSPCAFVSLSVCAD